MIAAGERRLTTAVDQAMLHGLLASSRIYRNSTGNFVLSEMRGAPVSRPVIVGFFSGVDMPGVCQLPNMADRILADIKDSMPYVLHLACVVGIARKTEFMEAAAYSFVDKSRQCSMNASNLTWGRLMSVFRMKRW
jgi:hypothetical protein